MSSSDESFWFVCWIYFFRGGGFPVLFSLFGHHSRNLDKRKPSCPWRASKPDSSYDHPQSPPTGAFLHDTSRALFGRQGRRPVGNPESIILAQNLLRLLIVLLNKTHAGVRIRLRLGLRPKCLPISIPSRLSPCILRLITIIFIMPATKFPVKNDEPISRRANTKTGQTTNPSLWRRA